jgi:hypothetical protein
MNYLVPVITVVAVGIWLQALARHKRTEATSQEPASPSEYSYLMQPPPQTKLIAWAVIAMTVVLASGAIFMGIQNQRPAAIAIGVIFGAAFGALGLYLLGQSSERIEVSEKGIGWRKRRQETYIAWDQVSSLTTTSIVGALVISAKSGAKIIVNKNFNGIARLTSDLRNRLQPGICAATLKDYQP